MKVTLDQLRKLIREAVAKNLQEQEDGEGGGSEGMDEDWGSSYSTGGSGGNRHGDSTDDTSPERSYRPESPSEREERLRRDDERDAYYGSRDTGWNESYRPKGKLNLESLRRMIRETVMEQLEEDMFEQAPAPPAPPAAAPAPVAPAAAPVTKPAPAAPAAPAAAAPAAPMAEAIRRIVRQTVRKHLQEKKEGKWMQKAGEEMEKKGTKGALHRDLGKKEGEKLSKAELESKKAALQKKGEGDKKLSAEDRKLLRRIIFALNAMKAKKD
jgi:pyruvate/2-oxoglutarate dehydrogenase complex dihydrolipoamide acyltransferase (E2) component